MTGHRSAVSVDGFNALPDAEATRRLLNCLNVPRWATEVASGRRYADFAALAAQAEASAAQLSDDELSAALDGHPRIGGHVDIGAGAKLLGGIVVGDDVLIGANSVVLDDVPAGATVVGIPAVVVASHSPRSR